MIMHGWVLTAREIMTRTSKTHCNDKISYRKRLESTRRAVSHIAGVSHDRKTENNRAGSLRYRKSQEWWWILHITGGGIWMSPDRGITPRS